MKRSTKKHLFMFLGTSFPFIFCTDGEETKKWMLFSLKLWFDFVQTTSQLCHKIFSIMYMYSFVNFSDRSDIGVGKYFGVQCAYHKLTSTYPKNPITMLSRTAEQKSKKNILNLLKKLHALNRIKRSKYMTTSKNIG